MTTALLLWELPLCCSVTWLQNPVLVNRFRYVAERRDTMRSTVAQSSSRSLAVSVLLCLLAVSLPSPGRAVTVDAIFTAMNKIWMVNMQSNDQTPGQTWSTLFNNNTINSANCLNGNTYCYCSLYGVTCGAAGSITSIRLPGRSLVGSFPLLLNGELNFDAFQYLLVLDLTNNQLTGTVPALNTLAYLQSIKLGHNSLSGFIPSVPASLLYLDVSFNEFTGTLPSTLQFTSITSLDVSHQTGAGMWGNVSAINGYHSQRCKQRRLQFRRQRLVRQLVGALQRARRCHNSATMPCVRCGHIPARRWCSILHRRGMHCVRYKHVLDGF